MLAFQQKEDLRRINNLFNDQELYIERFEFERGYGLIDDVFYLTVSNAKVKIILSIGTNLRFYSTSNVLLCCYWDLFVDTKGRPISRKRYQSQRHIELTLLNKEIMEIEKTIIGKRIKRFRINEQGDLIINIPYVGKIIASDDYDIREDHRHLYEIAILDSRKSSGITIEELSRHIAIKRHDCCEIIPSAGECGERFILK